MNFDYTDEQMMLRDSIAKWTAAEYSFEKRRAMLENHEVSRKNWAAIAELGLLAAPLPEAFGGLGGGAVDVSLIMEEFGKALVLEPYVQTVALGAGALMHGGSAQQQEEHLAAIAGGARVIAFAQAEPRSRWSLQDVETTGRAQGSGYVLNGHKTVVLGAPLADHLLVSARTGGERRDARGISLFLVPKRSKGVSVRDYPTVDGRSASEVYFENAAIGAEHLLGELDGALPLIERIVDEANAAFCAEAVGAMRVAFALTVEYTKTRKQFGRPLADFQVLQHRMVDMFMAVEESASMALLASLKLGGDALERARTISSAKVAIGKAGRYVGQNAIQLHGGMGLTDDMRVSHYFKRITMLDMTFGNVDHHLTRYVELSRYV